MVIETRSTPEIISKPANPETQTVTSYSPTKKLQQLGLFIDTKIDQCYAEINEIQSWQTDVKIINGEVRRRQQNLDFCNQTLDLLENIQNQLSQIKF